MSVTVHITMAMQSYIAHPYWPARNTCIDVEKKSGVNRQKSEDKRVAALKAQCSKMGMSYEEYLALKAAAAEQWYRKPQNPQGTIYIPRHQLAGAMVQTIATAPKALRGAFNKDTFRAQVQLGDFFTERTCADGVFARFVKLETSNQRSWQENEFLGVYLDTGKPFTAEGVISVDDSRHVDTVNALLLAALETVGVGAARKMGFGRGQITAWDVK